MMDHNSERAFFGLVCLALILGGFLSARRVVRAYGPAEHHDTGTHAQANYVAYVNAHPDTAVGATAVSQGENWNQVDYYLEHEDTLLSLNHFWDPYTGHGLPRDPLPGYFESAEARAEECWTDALTQYAAHDYSHAYENLGRVAHCVSDMGVPAHTNLDGHPGGDWYEGTYIPSEDHKVHSSDILPGASVFAIMDHLARISSDFDSDDVDGVMDNGTRRANGFTDEEGAGIAQECYPAAEQAVGGLFKLFYDTVKPTVELLRPSEGEVHSGLIGVPLEAMAKSFRREFTDPDFISFVLFAYATADDPRWELDYDLAGTEGDMSPESTYRCTWNNAIDDDKVWLRILAVDDGACESLPAQVWIRIDSTRPTATNAQP